MMPYTFLHRGVIEGFFSEISVVIHTRLRKLKINRKLLGPYKSFVFLVFVDIALLKDNMIFTMFSVNLNTNIRPKHKKTLDL